MPKAAAAPPDGGRVERKPTTADEAAVRALFDRWAQAVRDKNLEGIRADHDPNMLMFDVPPPFVSRGIEEYMATWQTFFPWQAKPVMFEFRDVTITAGSEVAFATAIGRCVTPAAGSVWSSTFG